MSAAPPGAVVRIFYDGPRLHIYGDALRTTSGRIYVVLDVRVQTRGKHVGRQHLICLIAKDPPPEASVFPLFWYPRNRRKTRNAA